MFEQQMKRQRLIMLGLQTGIVGLPNVGKSTMFNALTRSMAAEAANFPFCTIEPNIGIVPVPDTRLEKLVQLNSSAKKVPTTIEFVDIAGLVAGASEGKGKGNAFLSNIRMTDAIVQVVRCFEDENIIHVDGRVDPVEDANVINYELALADLATVERRLEKAKRASAVAQDKAKKEREVAFLEKLVAVLDKGQPARTLKFTEEDDIFLKELQLLTVKPMIYAANIDENELADNGQDNKHVQALQALAEKEDSKVVVMSARLEEELNGLDVEEAQSFLQELGVQDSGLSNVITSAYNQLGLLTFFTAGPQESRAWTIRQGMTAQEAAGQIHSDIAKGFIKAETISYSDYVDCGGEKESKDAGKLRIEGKDYIVQEGDVFHFRHR